MRLIDHMSHTGATLFRWRSYLLLAFVPILAFDILNGERVEIALGEVAGEIYEAAVVAIVLLGVLIRILTVGFVPQGTSGRNTDRGQVAERLNTTGLYSLVRNPLYLGNCLIYVGIALYSQDVLLALIMALVLLPYYERIIAAEEAFLAQKFGQAYADWAAETPAFLPRLHGFVPPALPFSLRWTIRREHASVFGAFTALYLLELGLHRLAPVQEPVVAAWHGLMALAVLGELTVQALRRWTRVLDIAER